MELLLPQEADFLAWIQLGIIGYILYKTILFIDYSHLHVNSSAAASLAFFLGPSNSCTGMTSGSPFFAGNWLRIPGISDPGGRGKVSTSQRFLSSGHLKRSPQAANFTAVTPFFTQGVPVFPSQFSSSKLSLWIAGDFSMSLFTAVYLAPRCEASTAVLRCWKTPAWDDSCQASATYSPQQPAVKSWCSSPCHVSGTLNKG